MKQKKRKKKQERKERERKKGERKKGWGERDVGRVNKVKEERRVREEEKSGPEASGGDEGTLWEWSDNFLFVPPLSMSALILVLFFICFRACLLPKVFNSMDHIFCPASSLMACRWHGPTA